MPWRRGCHSLQEALRFGLRESDHVRVDLRAERAAERARTRQYLPGVRVRSVDSGGQGRHSRCQRLRPGIRLRHLRRELLSPGERALGSPADLAGTGCRGRCAGGEAARAVGQAHGTARRRRGPVAQLLGALLRAGRARGEDTCPRGELRRTGREVCGTGSEVGRSFFRGRRSVGELGGTGGDLARRREEQDHHRGQQQAEHDHGDAHADSVRVGRGTRH
nr:hypothetical protein [Microbacterium sp. UBA6741]